MRLVLIPLEWQGWPCNDWTGPGMMGWGGPPRGHLSFHPCHSSPIPSFWHHSKIQKQWWWPSNEGGVRLGSGPKLTTFPKNVYVLLSAILTSFSLSICCLIRLNFDYLYFCVSLEFCSDFCSLSLWQKRRRKHFSEIFKAHLVYKNDNHYHEHWQKSWKDKSSAIMWPRLAVVGLPAIFRQ